MRPIVGLVMGSFKSDYRVMYPGILLLRQFKIPHELGVLSAHRTPDLVRDYALTAAERGLQVIIAGAGGSAHLPGMLASYTLVPVLGVPVVTTQLGFALGLDSLLSMTQLPTGTPVGVVGMGRVENAVLLAAQIVRNQIPGLLDALAEYHQAMAREVTNVKLSYTPWFPTDEPPDDDEDPYAK